MSAAGETKKIETDQKKLITRAGGGPIYAPSSTSNSEMRRPGSPPDLDEKQNVILPLMYSERYRYRARSRVCNR